MSSPRGEEGGVTAQLRTRYLRCARTRCERQIGTAALGRLQASEAGSGRLERQGVVRRLRPLAPNRHPARHAQSARTAIWVRTGAHHADETLSPAGVSA